MLEMKHTADRFLKGKDSSSGFTLIELLTVVALVAILAAIAIPLFTEFRQRAQVAAAIAGIKVIDQAIVSHFIGTDAYPDSLAEVGLETMRDPWGNPYQYTRINVPGKNMVGKARKDRFLVPINSDFDLYSMGPDGESRTPLTAKASQDDIIRANDGSYIGRAANY